MIYKLAFYDFFLSGIKNTIGLAFAVGAQPQNIIIFIKVQLSEIHLFYTNAPYCEGSFIGCLCAFFDDGSAFIANFMSAHRDVLLSFIKPYIWWGDSRKGFAGDSGVRKPPASSWVERWCTCHRHTMCAIISHHHNIIHTRLFLVGHVHSVDNREPQKLYIIRSFTDCMLNVETMTNKVCVRVYVCGVYGMRCNCVRKCSKESRDWPSPRSLKYIILRLYQERKSIR